LAAFSKESYQLWGCFLKYGLIIQGPRFSIGSGPNNAQSKNGFDTLETVKENIRRFKNKVEMVVLSSWHESGFKGSNMGSEAVLLESRLPIGFDYLNQKKQFFSLFVGASYISCNSDCTHIVKIRTDQLLPEEFIDWLDSFFAAEAPNTKKIICSEMLCDQAFYVGDFVFAGPIEQVFSFTNNVLQYDGRRIALNNSVDYVLKHVVRLDEQVAKAFRGNSLLRNELFFMFKQTAFLGLWQDVSRNYFSVLPEELYKKIIWRGRPMSDVFSNNLNYFIFHKELQTLERMINKRKILFTNKANVFTIILRTFNDLKRYVKARFEFYTNSK
jgi:hypothetical protein